MSVGRPWFSIFIKKLRNITHRPLQVINIGPIITKFDTSKISPSNTLEIHWWGTLIVSLCKCNYYLFIADKNSQPLFQISDYCNNWNSWYWSSLNESGGNNSFKNVKILNYSEVSSTLKIMVFINYYYLIFFLFLRKFINKSGCKCLT